MMNTFSVQSKHRSELIDITRSVEGIITQSQIKTGSCLLFTPHTTAAITINEGADPAVKTDILRYLSTQIPQDPSYAHNEGNSDAHIKSSLVGASEIILIENGRLVLGTWQSIYFCEFDGPRARRVHVQLTGEW